MKRSGNKLILLLIVLGSSSIISVFRLQQQPADVTTPREHDNFLHTTVDPQLLTVSPVTRKYRFKDDVIRGDDIQKAVARDIARFRRKCSDKKWALEILHSSDGIFQINSKICQNLPTQSEVSHLYGADPVVYGMETCEQFRKNVEQARDTLGRRAVPTVRVAGLFNTGTNAMAISLARNLQQNYELWNDKVRSKFFRKREQLFNVPWEKHVPPRFRNENIVSQDQDIDLRLVLPVVMVRDPYWWMQSMCKQSYDISWRKRGENRCPNIVNKKGINPVKANYQSKFLIEYDSLVHVWNEWNQEYLEADFPRLMIRFEDQLFHGEQVMQLISNCSGIPLSDPYVYQFKESKNHGASNNLVSAMSKYGNVRGRQLPFDVKDLEYAKSTLDSTLLQIFGYQHEVTPSGVSHAYRKKLGSAWGG
ncbi:hypothetical protein FisN_25Lh228 [Fistulifera solaris]|uniref:Sulfotransferase domain-containing protein n=1 Tax=Fistulifera solaris TaxID=1519565 RepID=A0A1Z5KRI6_FISSO|nr:hypothetical protein FisN_25Lh228 [Fistulifera solaris]|eukprot:GAX28722.1 hypothetical protein FisN_25Lh228 [Fistulifera solaris]